MSPSGIASRRLKFLPVDPLFWERDEERRALAWGSVGTQAAAEYVTRPEYIKELVTRLNVASPGEPPRLPEYYQVLIKVKVNGGVPVQISYVTHHVLE